MIDTFRLHPPGFGLMADPLLFGVSEGLLRLFPLPDQDFPLPCALAGEGPEAPRLPVASPSRASAEGEV